MQLWSRQLPSKPKHRLRWRGKANTPDRAASNDLPASQPTKGRLSMHGNKDIPKRGVAMCHETCCCCNPEHRLEEEGFKRCVTA